MPDRIEKLCAEKGLKMTSQRRVIARVLSEATDHPDVEELYRRASGIVSLTDMVIRGMNNAMKSAD